MRKRIGWLLMAGLLVLGLPSGGRAQYYEVPPVIFTGPLSHPRYESGGIFSAIRFDLLRQSRPIRQQTVAVEGLLDVDGTINVAGVPGTFVGSGLPRLDVSQVGGSPGDFQPGATVTLGYRFESGIAVELNWTHLKDAVYSASAGVIGPNFLVGNALENTFLFSPVSNHPVDFAGNDRNLTVGNPGATFGIWNAASSMRIEFRQRFDRVELNSRMPFWQTDNYRHYGLFGPRFVGFWERFRWRTVDTDVQGSATPLTTGLYENSVSNRLYGAHFGSGHDWNFANDPVIGSFSAVVDVKAALYADIAKGRVKYQLGNRSTYARRSVNMTSLVPSAEVDGYIMWYPWEAIQIRMGYSVAGYFNTISSPRPIDFNMGTIQPGFSSGTTRIIHGLNFGVTFVF